MLILMPTKTIHNVQLNYQEQGTGTPLVLVHGFPLDSRIWDDVIPLLAKQFRVIAPDLRGFGKSISSTPFTIASLAEDVHALLKEISALPCILGGLSMGGYVAMSFAKKFPADLRGLILMDTRAEADTAQAKENRGKMIQLAKDKGPKSVADEMMPKMIAEATTKSKPQVVSKLRQIMESQQSLTVQHALMALRDREDQTSFIPSIAVPTLILVGEHDAITAPAMSETMNKGIPNSTLIVVPDAGHISSMEKPNEIADAIRGKFK
jgi:pimeloyl-ACP methyl ester carboxylesterase